MSQDGLAGYLPVEVHQVRGVVWAAAARWLEDTLRAHGTLCEWGRAKATGELSGGRAAVRAVPAPLPGPDQRASWACRAYRRGGLASLLDDRYVRWGTPRPLAEARASQLARARGVPTPAVVAAVAYASGAFYRGDIVTELVPGTRSLADALFGAAAVTAREDVLAAAGGLLRGLEGARLLHADLNAHNVLVRSGGGDREAWVVDLDRCRDLGARTRVPTTMRRRLERSLAKLGERRGRPLAAADWNVLRDAYETIS